MAAGWVGILTSSCTSREPVAEGQAHARALAKAQLQNRVGARSPRSTTTTLAARHRDALVRRARVRRGSAAARRGRPLAPPARSGSVTRTRATWSRSRTDRRYAGARVRPLRRVNETLQEGDPGGIAELKDRDRLRHRHGGRGDRGRAEATVYVSVLGLGRKTARAPSPALRRPTASSRRGSGASCICRRTPALAFEYDRVGRAGVRCRS